MSWKWDGLYFSTHGMDEDTGTVNRLLFDMSTVGFGKCFSEIKDLWGGEGRLGLPRMFSS